MGGFVARSFTRWVELSSRREDGSALAFTRMLVALSLLYLVLPLLLTAGGRQVVRFAFADVAFGGYRPIAGSWFLNLCGGPRPETYFALLSVAALAGVCLLLGIFGRLPALLAAICSHAVLTQNSDTSGAGDGLLQSCLLLLVVGDATATLSLDARLRTGSFTDPSPVAAWPRLLALFQLVVMYLMTGLQKLVATAWTPFDGFSALYQILQSPHMGRFPDAVPSSDGLLVVPLAVGTALTLLFEVGFGAVLFSRRVRPAFACVGVALHIGIFALLKVGIFSFLSVALYPLLFPEGCARWVQRRAVRELNATPRGAE